MFRRNAFGVMAGILILGAVVHVATLWPRVGALAQGLGPRSWLIVAGYSVSALTALAACGLAALILWKASDRPEGRALTLFLAFLALFWGSLFRFLNVNATADSLEVTLSYSSGWVSQTGLLSFLLTFAAFLRFSAVFPARLTADRLPEPRLERFALARAARRVRVAFLQPAVPWLAAAGVYLLQRYVPRVLGSVTGLTPSEEQIPRALLLGFLVAIVLMAAFAVLAMGLGARNLATSYRLADRVERRRVLWVIAGFVTAWWMVVGAAGLMAVAALLPGESELLAAALPLAVFLAPLTIVLGAAVGTLYSGAIDPELALEKSAIYGALGVLAVVAFAAMENVVSELVEGWLQLPGFVGSMAAGGLVAVALVPLRGLLRSWIDRSRPPTDAPEG
jgi:hypothetical protein